MTSANQDDVKADTIAFEDAIVQVRCIGQTLVLMGEGLHTPDDPTGQAFIRLGQELLSVNKKLDHVLDDVLAGQRTVKAGAA